MHRSRNVQMFPQVQDISFYCGKQLRHAPHDRICKAHSRLELAPFDAVQGQDFRQAAEFPCHLDRFGNTECVTGVVEKTLWHVHRCRINPVNLTVLLPGAYRINNQHAAIAFPCFHQAGTFSAPFKNPDTREMPAKDLPGGEDSQTIV